MLTRRQARLLGLTSGALEDENHEDEGAKLVSNRFRSVKPSLYSDDGDVSRDIGISVGGGPSSVDKLALEQELRYAGKQEEETPVNGRHLSRGLSAIPGTRESRLFEGGGANKDSMENNKAETETVARATATVGHSDMTSKKRSRGKNENEHSTLDASSSWTSIRKVERRVSATNAIAAFLSGSLADIGLGSRQSPATAAATTATAAAKTALKESLSLPKKASSSSPLPHPIAEKLTSPFEGRVARRLQRVVDKCCQRLELESKSGSGTTAVRQYSPSFHNGHHRVTINTTQLRVAWKAMIKDLTTCTTLSTQRGRPPKAPVLPREEVGGIIAAVPSTTTEIPPSPPPSSALCGITSSVFTTSSLSPPRPPKSVTPPSSPPDGEFDTTAESKEENKDSTTGSVHGSSSSAIPVRLPMRHGLQHRLLQPVPTIFFPTRETGNPSSSSSSSSSSSASSNNKNGKVSVFVPPTCRMGAGLAVPAFRTTLLRRVQAGEHRRQELRTTLCYEVQFRQHQQIHRERLQEIFSYTPLKSEANSLCGLSTLNGEEQKSGVESATIQRVHLMGVLASIDALMKERLLRVYGITDALYPKAGESSHNDNSMVVKGNLGEGRDALEAMNMAVAVDAAIAVAVERVSSFQKLMPHQKLGVRWLLHLNHAEKGNGILADEMGLGKTAQSILYVACYKVLWEEVLPEAMERIRVMENRRRLRRLLLERLLGGRLKDFNRFKTGYSNGNNTTNTTTTATATATTTTTTTRTENEKVDNEGELRNEDGPFRSVLQTLDSLDWNRDDPIYEEGALGEETGTTRTDIRGAADGRPTAAVPHSTSMCGTMRHLMMVLKELKDPMSLDKWVRDRPSMFPSSTKQETQKKEDDSRVKEEGKRGTSLCSPRASRDDEEPSRKRARGDDRQHGDVVKIENQAKILEGDPGVLHQSPSAAVSSESMWGNAHSKRPSVFRQNPEVVERFVKGGVTGHESSSATGGLRPRPLSGVIPIRATDVKVGSVSLVEGVGEGREDVLPPQTDNQETESNMPARTTHLSLESNPSRGRGRGRGRGRSGRRELISSSSTGTGTGTPPASLNLLRRGRGRPRKIFTGGASILPTHLTNGASGTLSMPTYPSYDRHLYSDSHSSTSGRYIDGGDSLSVEYAPMPHVNLPALPLSAQDEQELIRVIKRLEEEEEERIHEVIHQHRIRHLSTILPGYFHERELGEKDVMLPILVVAPLSTLPQWKAEFSVFGVEKLFSLHVLNGTLEERQEEMAHFILEVEKLLQVALHDSSHGHSMTESQSSCRNEVSGGNQSNDASNNNNSPTNPTVLIKAAAARRRANAGAAASEARRAKEIETLGRSSHAEPHGRRNMSLPDGTAYESQEGSRRTTKKGGRERATSGVSSSLINENQGNSAIPSPFVCSPLRCCRRSLPPTPVLIIPHDLLTRKLSDFLRYIPHLSYQILIVDEAQRIKNSNAMLFSRLCQIMTHSRLVLTGTPLQNNVLELFSLMQFLMPDLRKNALLSSMMERLNTGLTEMNLKAARQTHTNKNLSNAIEGSLSQNGSLRSSDRAVDSHNDSLLPYSSLDAFSDQPEEDTEENVPALHGLPASVGNDQNEIDEQEEEEELEKAGNYESLLNSTHGDRKGGLEIRGSRDEKRCATGSEYTERHSIPVVPIAGGEGTVDRKELNAPAVGTDVHHQCYRSICRRIHQLLSPYLLRRDQRVIANLLPPKQDHLVTCPLLAYQKRALREVDAAALQGTLRGSPHIHRRKILLHPYTRLPYFYINEHIIFRSGKMLVLDLMMRFLQRTKHKFLVFCNWTLVLDVVETLCMWRGMPYVRLDGRTSAADREKRIHHFNNNQNSNNNNGSSKNSSRNDITESDTSSSGTSHGNTDANPSRGRPSHHRHGQDSERHDDLDPCCFLISKTAGGVGLNLQSADTVFLLDVDYNPQRDRQALARVYRVGQKREVRVFRLVVDHPVEHRLQEIHHGKEKLDNAVIQAGLYDLRSSALEREEALRHIIEETPEVKSGKKENVSLERRRCPLATGQDNRPIFPSSSRPTEADRIVDSECRMRDVLSPNVVSPRERGPNSPASTCSPYGSPNSMSVASPFTDMPPLLWRDTSEEPEAEEETPLFDGPKSDKTASGCHSLSSPSHSSPGRPRRDTVGYDVGPQAISSPSAPAYIPTSEVEEREDEEHEKQVALSSLWEMRDTLRQILIRSPATEVKSETTDRPESTEEQSTTEWIDEEAVWEAVLKETMEN